MPSMFVLPWTWTREERGEDGLVFASRFDGSGVRRGWQLFVGGIRLRHAVLRAPGALGVTLLADPIRGSYYTLSMWRDEASLLAFARGQTHRQAVGRLASLGPVGGILVSRDADSSRRPRWRETRRWLSDLAPGPYRREPGGAGTAELRTSTRSAI